MIGRGEQRRAAWQYWCVDLLWGAMYGFAHQALRLVPLDAASEFGGWVGGAWRRVPIAIGELRRTRVHEARARFNWRTLRPDDASPSRVEAALDAAYRNAARVQCEFAVLERLWPAARIAIEGGEHVAAARAAGNPVLIAGLHLGNWETIGPALIGLGHAVTAPYQPPPNRFDHAMVVAARQRYGVTLVPPGRGGGRTAYRQLAARRDVVLFYVDECVRGLVRAPLFGRKPHAQANIVYVSRLAALTGAAIVPAYSVRRRGAHFAVTFMPPVRLQRTADRQADLAANVATLNAVIEPIVLAHLEQWLWLFDLRLEQA